jgi:Icc-related predicted phosphoesterase
LTDCLFVSDLHGKIDRYRNLLCAIAEVGPAAVFLGGDLLPSGWGNVTAPPGPEGDFLRDYLLGELERLRQQMGAAYPQVFAILGNDDPRSQEPSLREGERAGLWQYLHGRQAMLGEHLVFGYSCVPPTPFLLKDWERYDVSRYVDPGCVSPEQGHRSVPVAEHDAKYGTIADDLAQLVGDADLSRAVLLFHTPPYRSKLDRASLDGQTVDHVPLDVHVGSIAVRRLIEERQPLATLHGHVHESARLTGSFIDRLGRTTCLSAAHDGPELAIVRFDLAAPEAATRELWS